MGQSSRSHVCNAMDRSSSCIVLSRYCLLSWTDNCQITNTSVFSPPPSKTIGHQCCCSSTVLSNRRGCSSDSVCLRLRVQVLRNRMYFVLQNKLHKCVAGLTDAMISWIESCHFLCLLAYLLCFCLFSSSLFVPVRM